MSGADSAFDNDLMLNEFNEVWNKSLESIVVDVQNGHPSGIYQWQQKLLAPSQKHREEAKSIISSLEYARDKHTFKNKADRELLIGIYYFALGDHQKALAHFNVIQNNCIEALTFIACIVKSTDPTLALELLKMAAAQGSAHASFHLGNHYNEHYNRTLQSWTKANAFAYLKKSAEAEHPDGLLVLSDFYYSGIPFDIRSTLNCLREAAAKGNADALLKLGVIYRQHDKVAKKEDAYKILQCGAEKNIPKFYLPFGEMHELGHATEVDLCKAIVWYRRAVENEVPDAILKCGELRKKYVDHPHVIYHSAFLFHQDPEVRDKFNELAKQNPKLFYELAANEPWEKLKPLLHKNNIPDLYNVPAISAEFNSQLVHVYDVLFDAYVKELENNDELDSPRIQKLIGMTKEIIAEILKCKSDSHHDKEHLNQLINRLEDWVNLSGDSNNKIFKKPELELEKALKFASNELKKMLTEYYPKPQSR